MAQEYLLEIDVLIDVIRIIFTIYSCIECNYRYLLWFLI